MDNPSAFPNPDVRTHDGFGISEGSPGMTLRDYFAGRVLEQCLRNAIDKDGGWDAAGVAYHAYLLADAMLHARVAAPTGMEVENAAPGTGEKLLRIARDFIDKHHVSCPEATGNDGIYEEAPLLVEQLANVAGYYSWPDEAVLDSGQSGENRRDA